MSRRPPGSDRSASSTTPSSRRIGWCVPEMILSPRRPSRSGCHLATTRLSSSYFSATFRRRAASVRSAVGTSKRHSSWRVSWRVIPQRSPSATARGGRASTCPRVVRGRAVRTTTRHAFATCSSVAASHRPTPPPLPLPARRPRLPPRALPSLPPPPQPPSARTARSMSSPLLLTQGLLLPPPRPRRRARLRPRRTASSLPSALLQPRRLGTRRRM